MLRFFFLLFITFNSFIYSTSNDDQRINTVLQTYFEDNSTNNFTYKLLEGGFSGVKNYLIDVQNNRYVLRLNKESDISVRRELYSFEQASKAGIAPIILYAEPEGSAVLMEFISGSTLTLEQAKDSENIIKIAQAIRKIHELPKNPISRTPEWIRIQNLFKYIKTEGFIYPESLEIAVEDMVKTHAKLLELNINFTTVHGDLNARNIFITANGMKFIDWSETNWGDPFSDLVYFAGQLDYNKEQELVLLKAYLGNDPTDNERLHYARSKRIHLATMATNLFYLSNHLSKQQNSLLDPSNPFLNWSYYINCFVGNNETLSPQHFYNYGQCCLNDLLNIIED